MTNNDYKQWKANLKSDPNWTPPVDQNFIPNILPILASLQLVKNPDTGKICPKLTYNNIPHSVTTPNGKISGEQLKALISVTATARRSVLLPKTTQVKNPIHGLYTPLVLYAHKLYNNISYNQWDRTLNPYLHAFLGTSLYNSYKSAMTNGKPSVDASNISKLRKLALTYKSGVKKGMQDKATAHRCNLLSLPVHGRNGIEDKKYTKYAVMSFLQLWLCHVELRKDSMILDLYDWDNMPEAYDAVSTISAKAEIKEEKTDLDLLWEI